MRYTETRIMLLDFKRSASQVFNENSIHISDKGLLLGVRDKNVEYMMNETAGVLAFVQEGDLWSYSPTDGKFSRIFSFRKENDGDFRDAVLVDSSDMTIEEVVDAIVAEFEKVK